MATEVMVEIDEGPFLDVLERAIRRHGELIAAILRPDPAAMPCARALAVRRLEVRRFACGSPGSGMPGEAPSWSTAELLDLVDGELDRMQADGTMPCEWLAEDFELLRRGCGCADCPVCHPRICPKCGGIVCASTGAPTAEADG